MRKTGRRTALSLLLTLAMLLGLLPSVVLAEEGHTHCLCGETSCTASHEHGSETMFTAWGNNANEKATLPTSGTYYLIDDVTLINAQTLIGNLTLCLNGHNIVGANGQAAITVGSGTTLTICDCKGTGKITHETDQTGTGGCADD